MRSTKIVATIGPSSRDPDVLEQMIRAGMDMARLNFAHGDPAEHAETAQLIRDAADAGRARGGHPRGHPGTRSCGSARWGATAWRSWAGGRASCSPPTEVDGSSERLPVAWRGFSELVDEGDVLYLADGAVRLRVSHVTGSDVVTQVEVGGSVASRQGLNLPNVTVSLPAVSDEDIALVDAGIDMGLDYFALSFVRRREDLEPVREHLRSRGSEIPLIAKIEKPQAAANAEEIVDAADGIMVARGDLGIELPIEEVPLVQKRLLALVGRRAKPAITATQMLESMVHSTRPTRAEVADVANAIFDGTDAVMLSQETAVGRHPVLAVAMMAEHRRDHRARAALRPLARRARPAGEQPVPRDRLRGRGRRLPARAQVHRHAHQHRHHGAADLRLPAEGAGAGAVTEPRRGAPLPAALGGLPGAPRGADGDARPDRGVRHARRSMPGWRKPGDKIGITAGLPAGTLGRHQPLQGPHASSEAPCHRP